MASTNDDEEEESESDEDSMEEECTNEDANMCFKALEEHEDEVNSNFNYNEFQDVLQELHFDLEKHGLKNVSFKEKIYYLQNELKENFENIEKAKISFEKEYEELKRKKNEWLISSLQKFSNGQKTFDMILASPKCIFDKNGLCYKPFKNKKYFKN